MLWCALVALGSVPFFSQVASAQAFTNGTLEWNLRPNVPYVHNDGAPFSEVYGFKTTMATPLLFGANANKLWYDYYMDRIERAQRFGYELPPGFDPGPEPQNPPPRRFRLGLFRGRYVTE
jgi:hypothetical protein